MQAIQTKFIGATPYRDPRIKAECAAKTIFLNWDDNLNPDQNHLVAANILMTKLGWFNTAQILGSGVLKDQTYVHVLGDK